MLLDFSKPYAEVHGLPGAVFEQNGQYFRSDGNPAKPADYVEEVVVKDDTIPPPVACYEQPTEPQEPQPKTFETMHWKHLKVLIESFGGEWTNRESAIEFMRGKS